MSAAAASDSDPLVHVGYSKTGTTWLQQRLFSSDAPGPFEPLLSREDILDRFVVHDALDHDGPAVRAAVAEGRTRISDDEIAVISHERLIGNPHSGGFDQVIIADRLLEAIPDARILITIREQRSMLVSLYQQYVKVGGACRMVDYCLPPTDHRLPLFGPTYLAYDRAIGLYQDRFGADRVTVLPYEQLRRDPQGFVDAVCRAAGTAPVRGLPVAEVDNPGWSPSLVALVRWANALGRRPDSAINPRAGVFTVDRSTQRRLRALDRRLPRSLGERIDRHQRALAERVCAGRFAASNRRTVELTGLDLAAFGYET